MKMCKEEVGIFHKIFLISNRIGSDFKNFSDGIGLSEMEVKFMFCIGSGCTKISSLISYFEKHKSTITQKIKSLEAKGYIEIVTNDMDKRGRVVDLTESGKEIYLVIKEKRRQHKDKIFSTFTEVEILELNRLLDKFNNKN